MKVSTFGEESYVSRINTLLTEILGTLRTKIV